MKLRSELCICHSPRRLIEPNHSEPSFAALLGQSQPLISSKELLFSPTGLIILPKKLIQDRLKTMKLKSSPDNIFKF